MEVQLGSKLASYIIHDRRTFAGDDAVYRAATELADEVMSGLSRLTHSHSLLAATLFITDRGAQLILITRSFDMETMNSVMDGILKSVSYDPASGNLYTYVIPILEVSPANDEDSDSDEFDVAPADGF